VELNGEVAPPLGTRGVGVGGSGQRATGWALERSSVGRRCVSGGTEWSGVEWGKSNFLGLQPDAGYCPDLEYALDAMMAVRAKQGIWNAVGSDAYMSIVAGEVLIYRRHGKRYLMVEGQFR
jgi:hypothetical protein